jgi:hypothetical protein
MSRCKWLSLPGLAAVALLALSGDAYPAKDSNSEHQGQGPMAHCAKACADCMRACESCARHCAHQVATGEKGYMTTLGTCGDCGDICATAAKIVSRRGPFAVEVCETCTKACDKCGAACAKYPQDKHMAHCAKVCRDCAKACRDMVKNADHEKGD